MNRRSGRLLESSPRFLIGDVGIAIDAWTDLKLLAARDMPSKKDNRLKRASEDMTRDVLRGFMRVHILHHAAKGPIFGLEMIEELRHHGYSIGPGTLYPMLHALENAGALQSTQALVDGKNRRYYRATKLGDALLKELQLKVRAFVDEVLEDLHNTSHCRAKKQSD